MKIYIQSSSSGCTSSLHEVAHYRKALASLGHKITENPEDAETIIFNTCGFSSSAESKSLKMIDEYKERFPQKNIIVGGCLTKINATALAEHYQGQSFGPENLEELMQAIGLRPKQEANVMTGETYHLNILDLQKLGPKFHVFYRVQGLYAYLRSKTHFCSPYLDNYFKSAAINETSAIVVAARGCMGTCTYCSIKKSRGPLVSTPLETILEQVKVLTIQGKTDLILRAEDLGAWGQDKGSDVTILLDSLIKAFPQITITIPFFEPSWLVQYREKIIPLLSSKQVICFYTPIHSGDDVIVKKMGRHYSTKEVIPIIREIKKRNPLVVIKTNILHSFPEERWRDFFKSLYYGFAFDFTVPITFTPRPGTLAARFSGQISPFAKWVRQFMSGGIFWFMNILKIFINVKGNFKKVPLL